MKVFADIGNTFFAHFHEHLTYFRYYLNIGEMDGVKISENGRGSRLMRLYKLQNTDANGMKYRLWLIILKTTTIAVVYGAADLRLNSAVENVLCDDVGDDDENDDDDDDDDVDDVDDDDNDDDDDVDDDGEDYDDDDVDDNDNADDDNDVDVVDYDHDDDNVDIFSYTMTSTTTMITMLLKFDVDDADELVRPLCRVVLRGRQARRQRQLGHGPRRL